MKKLMLCLTCILLTLTILTPLSAGAYYDKDESPLEEADLPEIYGTLNQRMSTRIGPGTEYVELATFLQKGEQVRIISKSYDVNNVPWVQVDFYYGKKHYRAYTGLKRFDGVDESAIPLEMWGSYPPATLTENVKPLYGPGEDYVSYDFTMKKGRAEQVLDMENGYAMMRFYAEGDKEWYSVWVPADCLW